jgi:hypothetical protein
MAARPYAQIANDISQHEFMLSLAADADVALARMLAVNELRVELDAKIDESWERAQASPSAADIRRSIERGDWT